MKKKSLNIHKRDNQSFRHRLLLSIFRIAAPVTAIVCTVSIVMLTLNYRQTVINSQAAATEKVRSDIAHIVDNTQILSQDMIFNSEIQQIIASSTAGEQFPQNTDVAYHITGFIAKESVISTLGILTGAGSEVSITALGTLFTPITAGSFLAFILLYTPCVAAISAVKRELGSGWKAAGVAASQCVIAWVVSFLVYHILLILA